jgi:hypothetical protein
VTEEELGRVVDIVVRALEQRFEQRLERWTRAVEAQMQRRLDAIRADIDTALAEDPEGELDDDELLDNQSGLTGYHPDLDENEDEEPEDDDLDEGLDDDERDETAFEGDWSRIVDQHGYPRHLS